MPDRFFTVDELYNTNRNPAELGIVHPLVWENEDSLVGQLGYSTGALMNSDKHADVLVPQLRRRPLVHDGARPQLAVQRPRPGASSTSLAAVEWTAGVGYLNCVTFNEVSELLAAAVAAGDIDSDGNASLSGLLADAKAAFDQGDYEGAKDELEKFVEQTRKLNADQLTLKGNELIDWAKSLK